MVNERGQGPGGGTSSVTPGGADMEARVLTPHKILVEHMETVKSLAFLEVVVAVGTLWTQVEEVVGVPFR